MLNTKDNIKLSFIFEDTVNEELQFQFDGFRAIQQSAERVNQIITF